MVTKMKRKDSGQLNDDFFDYSLSSPATKIRRLDAELPPICKEEEMEVPIVEHYEAEDDFVENTGTIGGEGGSTRGIVIEELPTELENEERAIVVFRPPNSTLASSPSDFSVTLNPQLISEFRNQMMCTYQQSNPFRQADDGAKEWDGNRGRTNSCMAVVPWVPSQAPPPTGEDGLSCQSDVTDMMVGEETETTPMEVEDSNITFEPSFVREPDTALNEGIHQWQQQHCMIPQLPQNTSTPIVWFK